MNRSVPRIALSVLSSLTLWIIVALVGIAFVVVWVHNVDGEATDAKTRAAKLEAIRVAERRAAANARVQQCLASIPNLRKINRFVEAVKVFHEVAARNSYATVRATPRDDPDYRVRLRNYRRIRATVPAVRAVSFPVPTRAQCKARRRG